MRLDLLNGGVPIAPADLQEGDLFYVFRVGQSGLARSAALTAAGLREALGLDEEPPVEEVITATDVRASGTTYGAIAPGDWRERVLNTVVGASLSGNRVVVPAGTWEVFARSPAVRCNSHQARLYNHTAAAPLLLGSSAFTPIEFNAQSDSVIAGRITLAVQSHLALQHRVSIQGNTGLTGGIPSSFGSGEVYAQLILRRIA